MRIVVLALSLLLVSCGEAELSPEDQARVDAAKIASVERAAILPAVPISPEPITFADIESNDLFGAGCSFIPTGTTDIIALTQAETGALKVDGEIMVLAADKGSKDAPLGSRTNYDGLSYSLALDINEDDGSQSGSETVDFPAEIEVRNGRDQTVFRAPGTAQCGS